MLDETWTLAPSVALRPEPFGALAYHFGNRRLTFLKRPELVAVVRGLADAPDVRTALQRAGVAEAQFPLYVAALHKLATAEMITPLSALDSVRSAVLGAEAESLAEKGETE